MEALCDLRAIVVSFTQLLPLTATEEAANDIAGNYDDSGIHESPMLAHFSFGGKILDSNVGMTPD